jgi:hypothetical protein
VAHPTDKLDLVELEALPGAPPIAQTTPGQLRTHVVGGDLQAGRQALQDDHQRPAVGLTGGQVSKHRVMPPSGHGWPLVGEADPGRVAPHHASEAQDVRSESC